MDINCDDIASRARQGNPTLTAGLSKTQIGERGRTARIRKCSRSNNLIRNRFTHVREPFRAHAHGEQRVQITFSVLVVSLLFTVHQAAVSTVTAATGTDAAGEKGADVAEEKIAMLGI